MSCLFNSLSYFIDASPQEIRDWICDYLEENNPVMEGMDTRLVLALESGSNDKRHAKSYIPKMRRRSTWGGGDEIISACNLWSLKLLVHNIRDNSGEVIEFLPIDGDPVGVIHISWNGNHYTSMPSRKIG